MARCAGKDETNNASPGRDNFTLMQSILTLLRSLHLYALARPLTLSELRRLFGKLTR